MEGLIVAVCQETRRAHGLGLFPRSGPRNDLDNEKLPQVTLTHRETEAYRARGNGVLVLGRSLLVIALIPIQSTFFLVSDSLVSHRLPPKHGKEVQSMEADEPRSLGVTPVS